MIRWRDRAGDRGSVLRRACRPVCRAAAAASSAGLNLKRKKSLFRGGGGGAGAERSAGRPAPTPTARPKARPAPALTLFPAGKLPSAFPQEPGPPKPQGRPASQTPQ